MNACPRCRATEIRTEYQGREGKEIVWSVLHCERCSFTWRDSEPPETTMPDKRDPFFNLKPEELDKFPIVLPPGIV
jgi:C4-type Zn-finger protein